MPRLLLGVCSASFGVPRDQSYEINATKQSVRCEGLRGFDSNKEEVVPKVEDVSLVDGAFSGDGEENVVMKEGVVVASSSL
ncbi:hypothetical protein Tco_0061965 [Tanacetum coccineum]